MPKIKEETIIDMFYHIEDILDIETDEILDQKTTPNERGATLVNYLGFGKLVLNKSKKN